MSKDWKRKTEENKMKLEKFALNGGILVLFSTLVIGGGLTLDYEHKIYIGGLENGEVSKDVKFLEHYSSLLQKRIDLLSRRYYID